MSRSVPSTTLKLPDLPIDIPCVYDNLWSTDLSGASPGGFIMCSNCGKIVSEEGAKFGSFKILTPPEPHCRECSKLAGFFDRSAWSPHQAESVF